MKTLDEFKAEQMKDPEFAKEYKALQPEFEKIRSELDISNKKNEKGSESMD